MKREILVICFACPDWGLVSKASEFAAQQDRKVHVLVDRQELAREACGFGADQVDVLFMPKTLLDDYAIAAWISRKVRVQWKPDIILAPVTIQLRAVLPILAAMLHTGLTADCTDLKMQPDGTLIQVRPTFENSLLAWIRTRGPIQMATVRPGVFKKQKHNKKRGEIRSCRWDGQERVRQISVAEPWERVPVMDADIIIAGGRGLGSKEGFELLKKVAGKAGAGVGASRMAVAAGMAPYSCQIGQTGRCVRPRLYIAMGISGAVQHLVGMSGAGRVIAVNSDSNAPIFRYADYGIVGDCIEVLKQLEKRALGDIP